MKRYFLLLLFALATFSLSAQEHQKFMGIPIDGSVAAMVNQLKAKGFEEISVDDTGAAVEGMFSGERRMVFIYGTPTTKKVYQVIVVLKESSSWSTLKSTYTEYKKLLENKYGNAIGGEEFNYPYYDGCGSEMTAVRNDECNYTRIFETSTGSITLLIGSSCCVYLAYVDKINNDICDREKETVMSDDL